MGRKRKLTDEQVNEIFAHPEVSSTEYAKQFGVSYVTILKVRKGYGAYKPIVTEGTMVLNPHGEVIGVQETV